MRRCIRLTFLVSALASTEAMRADSIPVRHVQFPMHRHMTARTSDGKTVASGEFLQAVQGDTVTMELIYHFRDGSLDDEVTTYTQEGVFRLLRTHHIQKGPFFPKPIDVTIDAATGTVTFRTTDSDGSVHEEHKHMDLPRDLANGIIGTLLLNVPHNTKPFRVAMLAPVAGGRLIQLEVSPENDQQVQLGGQTFPATVFRVHPVLGSVISFLARLIGIQPKDVTVWVLEGDEPAVALVVGQLGGNGPIISSDLVGTSFSQSSAQ